MNTESAPEFSRVTAADRVPPQGAESTLEAKPAEREALAKRFDLVELKYLRAQLTLTPGRDQTIAVTGHLSASVVQNCVVTLEPVAGKIEADIDVIFIPSGQHRDGAGPAHVDDSDDDYEVFTGGKIDLGELVAQNMGINLDPYPRKPGAALPVTAFGAKAEKPRPMAQLAALAKAPKDKK